MEAFVAWRVSRATDAVSGAESNPISLHRQVTETGVETTVTDGRVSEAKEVLQDLFDAVQAHARGLSPIRETQLLIPNAVRSFTSVSKGWRKTSRAASAPRSRNAEP